MLYHQSLSCDKCYLANSIEENNLSMIEFRIESPKKYNPPIIEPTKKLQNKVECLT